jgi:carboxymethylenebutenolidase
MLELESIDVSPSIRALVAKPRGALSPMPSVIAYSDIFQLTPPHVRMVQRLASYGFVVIAPELYGRIEPKGTVLDFERDRQRALDDAAKMEVAWIDEDRRAVIDYARSRADVAADRLAVAGWCFGGHLAFRAALEPAIKAAACFYATGVHDGALGRARGDAGTLERAHEIRGTLLLVWGRNDPHIPVAGRSKIHRALEGADVRFSALQFDAEHAFMRDEGPRYDPEAADRAFDAMIDLFERI